MVDLSRLSGEERLLVRRFEDLAAISQKSGSPRFSFFLNERQQLLAEEVIRQRKLAQCMLYGGWGDAQRRMLGVFPDWQQPEEADFPIEAVAIHLPRDVVLSHRDVLGSLMGLRITREGVGDILLQERRCDVFVQEPLAAVITGELTRIGRTGVRCETGGDYDYRREEAFEERRGTLSSPRMDALVAILTGLSREKGQALIRAGLVQRNYQVATSSSAAFAPGDVVRIRGYGKFSVEEIQNPTKKGRLPVIYKKYV